MMRFSAFGKRFIPPAYRPAVRHVYQIGRAWMNRVWPSAEYEERKRYELNFFTESSWIQELPAIAHYWSTKYLVPVYEPFGFTNALECFRSYLQQLCLDHSPAKCAFLSIGAGSGEAEINMARWLYESGTKNFSFECMDINEASMEKGRRSAALNGVQDCFSFSVFDVNRWKPKSKYQAVVALQSLHHVQELELLFDRISGALADDGYFMTDDMIGRNGHQRWPEALTIVQELWRNLPPKYKYNNLLQRFEDEYDNWDCSTSGFEGVRAQDILPLLIQKFHFEVFIAFGNVIDIFIDRTFGHNFDPNIEWDRAFIDRVQEIDAAHLEGGLIKPTHMLAVMRKTPAGPTRVHKTFTPQFCVRSV